MSDDDDDEGVAPGGTGGTAVEALLHNRLVEVFFQFARGATGDFHVHDILRDLCAAAGDVLQITGAGVAYPDDRQMRFAYASTAPVDSAERMQDALAVGPCHDAYATGQVVIETDLAAHPGRWPRFTEHALRLGMRAVAAVPLRARGRVWGALDLYRSQPGPFPAADLAAAGALADVAVGYLVMAHDRDVARAAQRAAEHAATHDALTGLANRTLLRDRLDHALAARERHGGTVSVLFVDLDGFKAVNDSLGHLVGDEVLIEVARRLGSIVRTCDTLARYAGDEFLVVCEDPDSDVPSGHTVQSVVARIHAALEHPVVVHGRRIPVGASVGAATAGDHSMTTDALLKAADDAMYRSKSRARDVIPDEPH